MSHSRSLTFVPSACKSFLSKYSSKSYFKHQCSASIMAGASREEITTLEHATLKVKECILLEGLMEEVRLAVI